MSLLTISEEKFEKLCANKIIECNRIQEAGFCWIIVGQYSKGKDIQIDIKELKDILTITVTCCDSMKENV